MIRSKLRSVSLLALCAGFAVAGAANAADLVFLTPDQVAAVIQTLPQPPPAGSAQAQVELSELKQIEVSRTPAQFAQANDDYLTKNVTIFAVAVGPGFDPKVLPATAKLFADVRNDEKAVADQAKDIFKRSRPWIVDPTLQTCSTSEGPLTSYPSGHATMGYSMATVLAQLVPEKAAAIMARADLYGRDRLICSMHFRSDVEGGRTIGILAAQDMMQSPAFKAEFDAAEQELRTAHLTGQ